MSFGRIWAVFLRYFYFFAKLDHLCDLFFWPVVDNFPMGNNDRMGPKYRGGHISACPCDLDWACLLADHLEEQLRGLRKLAARVLEPQPCELVLHTVKAIGVDRLIDACRAVQDLHHDQLWGAHGLATLLAGCFFHGLGILAVYSFVSLVGVVHWVFERFDHDLFWTEGSDAGMDDRLLLCSF